MAGENDSVGTGVDPAALLQMLQSRGIPNTGQNASRMAAQYQPQPMPQPTVPGTPPVASAPAPAAPVASGAGALPQPPPVPPGAPDTAAPVAAPMAGAVDPAASGDSGGFLQALVSAILGSGALGAGAYGLSRLGRAPSTQGPIPGAGAGPVLQGQVIPPSNNGNPNTNFWSKGNTQNNYQTPAWEDIASGAPPPPNGGTRTTSQDPFADLNDLKGKRTYGTSGAGPTIDGTADPMQSAMAKAVDEPPVAAKSAGGPVKQLENASETTTAANTQQKQLATPTERSDVKTADAKAAIEGNVTHGPEVPAPAAGTAVQSRAPVSVVSKAPVPAGPINWSKVLGEIAGIGKVVR